MSLSDILGLPGDPVQKCINAIEKGETDKIQDADVEALVMKILSPLKARLDEILARPANAKILECKAVHLTDEELKGIDVAKLDDEQSRRLIAQAMSVHTGHGVGFAALQQTQQLVVRYYCGDPALIRMAFVDYLTAPPKSRPQAWLHDALGVGVFVRDGQRKLRRFPLRDAAENAREWLLNNSKNNPEAQMDGWLTFEVSEDEIKDKKTF